MAGPKFLYDGLMTKLLLFCSCLRVLIWELVRLQHCLLKQVIAAKESHSETHAVVHWQGGVRSNNN
jgi:hypothetical protein